MKKKKVKAPPIIPLISQNSLYNKQKLIWDYVEKERRRLNIAVQISEYDYINNRRN